MASLLYIPQYKQTVLNVPGGITNSQTTGIILGNTDGIDTTKPGLLCLTYADPLDTDTAEFITFTSIDVNKELQGVTRAREDLSAKAHLNNAQVAFVVSKAHINRINDKLTGVDTTVVTDTNGNEILTVSQVSSAVNYVNIKNSATGNGPEVQALGDNTNIDLILVPKGTGDVAIYVPTGNDATLVAKGADTDVDLSLTPKGAGKTNVTAGDFNLASATANIQVNDADPKRGIYIPASGLFPATTNGCGSLSQGESATNKINYKYLPFDGTAEEYGWFGPIQAPDWWDLSTITVKFHWTSPSGSGDVIWGAAALARSDDDAIDTALGSAVTVTDTVLTNLDVQTTSATSAITVGGTPAKGDLLFIRVYRDADAGGDTLNGVDAYLTGITIKYGVAQYDDQ